MSKNKAPDYFKDFEEYTDAADFAEVDAKEKEKEEFEALLGVSLQKRGKKVSVGEKINGEILVLGKEDVFVSIASGKEGILPKRELLDEKRECPYKVGDRVDCFVAQVRGDEIRLSKKAGNRGAADNLEDAYDMMLPVQGRIVEVCKGGVRVNIQGKLAFCPISQIDVKHVEDPAEYVGKSFQFRITEFKEGGRNIVVSRRKLQDEENALNSVSFLEENTDGAVVSGRVTRLEKFGAFVELAPGVEGLVHVSEIAWSRTNDPAEVLSAGQEVTVKILKREVLNGKTKISLSIKQVTPKEESANAESSRSESRKPSPALEKYPVGTPVLGKIVRKEVYGVFVELEPGLSGLIHKSKFIEQSGVHFEKLRVGDSIQAQITEVKDGKVSLGFNNNENDEDWRAHQRKQPVNQSMGTFADLMKVSLKTSKTGTSSKK